MKIEVVGGAILHDGRCFVAQRPQGGSAGLKWEFPGGKPERGEDNQAALKRELQEELGVDVLVHEYLGCGEAQAGKRLISLKVYAVELVSPAESIELREHLQSRWVSAEELTPLDWAEADVPVVPLVKQRLVDDVGE